MQWELNILCTSQVKIGCTCLHGLLCVSHDCFHASHVYALSCYRSAPSIHPERAEHSQSVRARAWHYKIPYHYMHTFLIHVIPISRRMHSHFIMMRNILDFLISISAGASKPLTTHRSRRTCPMSSSMLTEYASKLNQQTFNLNYDEIESNE